MSASRFYAALTALLFLAVSAWAGAALFGRIPAPQEAEESSPPQPGGSLRGIVLRQEQVFQSGKDPPGTYCSGTPLILISHLIFPLINTI